MTLVEEFSRESGLPEELDSSDSIVYILGIDPGVTTGLSVLKVDVEDGIPNPADREKVKFWNTQISYGGSGNATDLLKVSKGGWPEQEIASQIYDLFIQLFGDSYGNAIIVIEDFVVRKMNSTRDFLSPVRITAGILQELYSNKVDHNYIYFQSPSDAKGTCTDERMDRWGFSIRTQKDRHGRDANRHAVLFLRKLLQNPKTLLFSPEEK